MRLLKIILKNAIAFGGPVELTFNTSDGVRVSALHSDHDMLAYKVQKGVYTQVMMGVIGANATGKTTVLEIISLVLHIVFGHQKPNFPEAHRILNKLMSKNEGINWEVYFIAGNKIYLLESEIQKNAAGTFEFKKECLRSKALKSTSGSALYDFSSCEIQTRENYKTNSLFKNDTTIAEAAIPGEYQGRIFSMESAVNHNSPYWQGRPDTRLINCFDPNIEDIIIETEGSPVANKMQVSFKNQNIECVGNSLVLGNFLSSGTVKGLSLLPGVIEVLKHGGYLIVDELENHFNKKIVEWFLELFSDVRTNPHGACLVFSTHYPEILDFFRRKDNIYVTRREKDNFLGCIRFSDEIKRNDISKSNVILANVIKGTAPSFKDVDNATKCIIDYVSKEM